MGRTAVVLAGVAALLGGCSMGADMAAADKAIAAFHRGLNAGQSRQLFAATAPEFKAVTTEGKGVAMFDAVHGTLGAFKDGKSVGFNDNVSTAGHMLLVRYASHFQNGTALETFTFRLSGGQPLLVGYNVNSDAFLPPAVRSAR